MRNIARQRARRFGLAIVAAAAIAPCLTKNALATGPNSPVQIVLDVPAQPPLATNPLRSTAHVDVASVRETTTVIVTRTAGQIVAAEHVGRRVFQYPRTDGGRRESVDLPAPDFGHLRPGHYSREIRVSAHMRSPSASAEPLEILETQYFEVTPTGQVRLTSMATYSDAVQPVFQLLDREGKVIAARAGAVLPGAGPPPTDVENRRAGLVHAADGSQPPASPPAPSNRRPRP